MFACVSSVLLVDSFDKMDQVGDVLDHFVVGPEFEMHVLQGLLFTLNMNMNTSHILVDRLNFSQLTLTRQSLQLDITDSEVIKKRCLSDNISHFQVSVGLGVTLLGS